MVKIFSNWTNAGGSTEAFINLTNELNGRGIDCMFYGPHKYHTFKCRGDVSYGAVPLSKNDVFITHFTAKPQKRPDVKKFILSCHEQDVFPLKKIKFDIYDKIHFVSEHQRDFHGIDHPHFICTNVMADLKPNPKRSMNVAGIIGSVDKNKQTHISIERALKDGCGEVVIFGPITDQNYFETMVKPLVDNNENVNVVGHVEDKQKIYDSINYLYFSSINECCPTVIGECKLTNTEVRALPNKNYMNIDYKPNDEVVETWIKELGL
jgi:hypothetical protein